MSGVVWAQMMALAGGGGSSVAAPAPSADGEGGDASTPIIVPRRFDTRLEQVVRLVQPRLIKGSRSCGNSGGGNAASERQL